MHNQVLIPLNIVMNGNKLNKTYTWLLLIEKAFGKFHRSWHTDKVILEGVYETP